MASFTTVANSLGGIVGALGIVVAAVFGTLYGLKRAEKDKDNSTISTYKEYGDSRDKLLLAKNEELNEARLKHVENQKWIELLEQKANILENQVTQAPSINKLISQLSSQHKEQMDAMQKMTQELGNIAKNIIKSPMKEKG